jgi:hypothetical protein
MLRFVAEPQSQPIKEDLTDLDELVSVSEFVQSQELSNVDFIKIDVDGTELDVVISAQDIVSSRRVLGFAIEVNWTGSYLDTDNTFHNIDRKMRELGYSLVDVSCRRYSRKSLPLPFILNIVAQTEGGQIMQGDAVYLRDAASEHDQLIWNSELSGTKLLKLAALYDIFNLPDLAAELIDLKRAKIAAITDPKMLLDALTPPLRGRKVSYAEYIRLFETETHVFFPDGGPPSTRLPGPGTLVTIDRFIINNALDVSRDDDGLHIQTPREQWSYAISYPVSAKSWAECPARFDFELSVLEGAIGIGALSLDNRTFIQEKNCYPRGWENIRISINDVSQCTAIVVRNVAPGYAASKVIIRLAEGCVIGSET